MKPKRKRAPADKKRLDYKKQRRGFTEYTQSLRHGKWRRKKRRPAQKTERQAERLAVATRSRATPDVRDPGFDPGEITRPTITKWGATPLGRWVEIKKRERVTRVGSRVARRKANAR